MFDSNTILLIASTTLAIFFVILEQLKGKKTWRLWVALLWLVVALVSIVVEANTTKAMNAKRRADLLLIQKQNAALNSLCFELNLQPYDSTYAEGCALTISTASRVVTRIARSGFIAEYINFTFHPDTGWYRSTHFVIAWPNIRLDHDSTNNTVRFEMAPFGIKSQSNDLLMWKAERLADLAQVKFRISMGYPLRMDPDVYFETPNLDWSPIRSIRIYANSYQSDNLITTLMPRERPNGRASHDHVYFHPQEQSVVDFDNFHFYIDLLQMRSHILKNLDSDS